MNRVDLLFEKAKIFYLNGDPSHDISHVERVLKNCRWLAEGESVRIDILLAAAILHDIVNLPKNHPERLQASALAAEKSKSILIEVGFSDDEIEAVGTVITEHSYSLGKMPTSIESQILQDADKLDALGAIGIMRTVTCGARMHTNYYDTKEPFIETRNLDDKAFTIDHFYTKLFKLADMMNTEKAKAEALRRNEYMKNFLEQLRREI